MRYLLTTASALALFAAPAFAATTPTPPGAGASGATTSGSTASQSTTNPSAGASTKAMGAQSGSNHTGTSQTGTSQTGTSQAGTSQAGTSQAGTSQTATSGNTSGNASQADQSFVKKAGSGNIAEVQEGKLAAQKSHDPAVQEFGRWMQTDHTMAQGLLMQSAQSSNIQVPTKPDAAAINSMKKLQTASGTQFNRQYIDGAVTDHQKTVKLFQDEAQNGQDAQLKTYAKAMLPALQAHLQEAQALQSNISGSSTASGAGGTSATGNAAVGAGGAGTAKLNQQELNKIQHR